MWTTTHGEAAPPLGFAAKPRRVLGNGHGPGRHGMLS